MLPIVLFAGAGSLTRAVVVALVFVVIGLAEFLLTPLVERQTVEVGSFLIVFAAFGGLELDGLTGALLGVLGVIVAVAMFDEFGRADATGSVGTARSRYSTPRMTVLADENQPPVPLTQQSLAFST